MSSSRTPLSAVRRRVLVRRAIATAVSGALMTWSLAAPATAAPAAQTVAASAVSKPSPKPVGAPATEPQGQDSQVIAIDGVDSNVTLTPDSDRGEVAARSGQIATIDFVAAGITWEADPENPVLEATMRVREDGQWSSWSSLEVHPTPRTEETSRTGTEPLITTGADGVQVNVTTTTGQSPKGLQVSLIDPGEAPTDAVVAEQASAPASTVDLTAAPREPVDSVSGEQPATAGTDSTRQKAIDQLMRPAIVTRAQWGAEESWATNSQVSTELQAMYVHHTAGTNDYTRAQAVQQLRAIYQYHTRSLQWGDIGYHFLVDKYGTVYEGRRGSLEQLVLGAQAGGFNTNTIGVSAMGNYDITAAPQALITSLNSVLAWQAARYGLDATSMTTLTSRASSGSTSLYSYGTQVRVPAVLGHRDTNATACPGRYLYPQLPAMRTSIAQKVASAEAKIPPQAPTLSKGSFQIGSNGMDAVARWNPVPGATHYQIMYRARPHGGGDISALPWLAGRTTTGTSLTLGTEPGETAQFAVRAVNGSITGPQTYLGQHTGALDWSDSSAVTVQGMGVQPHSEGVSGQALVSQQEGSALTLHQVGAATGVTLRAQVPSGSARVEVTRGNRVVGGMRFVAGGPTVCTLPIDRPGDDIRVTVKDDARIDVLAVSAPRAGQSSVPATSNPCQVTFADNPYGSQYFEAIHWIQWSGISNGYAGDNTYRKPRAISRGESLAFIHRFMDPSATGASSTTFTDVPPTHTFFDAISWAVDEGIAMGYADGTYRSAQSVTRAEFAALFYRAVGNGEGADEDPSFPDVAAESTHAEAIAWMSQQGLINGYSDGRFQPNRQISRGEVGVIMHRYALATGH